MTPATPIAAVRPRDLVRVAGVIRAAALETVGTSPAVRCVLTDGGGEIDLLFLGQDAVPGLAPGRPCAARGRAARHGGRLVIWNPRYDLAPVPEGDTVPEGEPVLKAEEVRRAVLGAHAG